jgi:hypothetical protein
MTGALVTVLSLATVGVVGGHEYGGVQCRTEYITLWDTTYKETESQQCTTVYEKVCETEYEKVCETEYQEVCHTVYEEQCHTVYQSVCEEQYRTEYEPYTETECTTHYRDDCEYRWEGSGNEKVWAPIPGTCKKNPYDECKDVAKTKAKQVTYPVCQDVPEEKCAKSPRPECSTVPEQRCTTVPRQTCATVPRQNCVALHKKVPVRVSKQLPRQVCDSHTSQQDQVLTDLTRNVSLANILGLININQRKAGTELDTANENNAETKGNVVVEKESGDSFLFL